MNVALPKLLLLFALADATADELTSVAMTAMEESFSSPRSFEVAYLRRHVRSSGGTVTGPAAVPDAIVVWSWKNGKQAMSESLASDRSQVTFSWVFDGNKTYEWSYRSPGVLKEVWIRGGGPRGELLLRNSFAALIGRQAIDPQISLLDYLKVAQTNKSVVASKEGELLRLGLGVHNEKDVSVVVDPVHDFRMTSWRYATLPPSPYKDQSLPVATMLIEEYQSVVDEVTGEKVWFPRKGRRELPLMAIAMDIESVKLNTNIPDSRFQFSQPPIGTQVYTDSGIAGRPPEATIVGGEAARQKRMEEVIEKARQSRQAELDRLAQSGVQHDATPNQGSRWAFYGLMLAAVAFAGAFVRRFVVRSK